MRSCSNRSVLTNGVTGQVITVPCMSWKCEECASLMGYKISRRLYEAVQMKQSKARLLTLTIENDHGKLYATTQFNRFRTRMRQLGYMNVYFWCKEFQVRGARHFHVVVHEYIPIKIISKVWNLGYAWISAIEGARASRYVSKYLAKGNDSRFEHNERRYGCSRGYMPVTVHTPNSDWTYYTRYQFEMLWGTYEYEKIVRRGFIVVPDYSFIVEPIQMRLTLYLT